MRVPECGRGRGATDRAAIPAVWYRPGMPRYFFHTHLGDEVVNDPEGEELADPDAAWDAARTMALQLLQGAGSDPALLRASLIVTGEDGEVVLEFPLTEAVDVPSPRGGGPNTRH